MIKIYWKKLDKNAIIPTKSTEFSAGFDLFSLESKVIHPKKFGLFKTGIAWELENKIDVGLCEINKLVYGQVQGRSGMAFNHSIELTNCGVIDMDYRGEIGVKLYNVGDEAYTVSEGDRIAQIIIKELPLVEVGEADELTESKRGSNGFGSSGK